MKRLGWLLLALAACSSTPASTTGTGGAAADAGPAPGACWLDGGWTDCDGGAPCGCVDDLGLCRSMTCQDSLDCGDPHACGHNGRACVDCDDGNPCTDDRCALAGCAHYIYIGKACAPGMVCDADGGCSP